MYDGRQTHSDDVIYGEDMTDAQSEAEESRIDVGVELAVQCDLGRASIQLHMLGLLGTHICCRGAVACAR